jgi:hypothetical protein
MEKSLGEYKRWGFFARETPTIDVYQKKSVGRLDRNSRLNLLQEFLEKKRTVTMKEYLGALAHSISRQQALQDFNKVAKPKAGTHGRGAQWIKK